MAQDLPDDWAAAMIAAGCVDPRRKDDVASMTQLAERTNLTTETIRRMIRGIGRPEPLSVKRVADVLGTDVYTWVVTARGSSQPWTAPEEAEYLTEEEGVTLTRLIRQMTEHRRNRPPQSGPDELADRSPLKLIRAQNLRREAEAAERANTLRTPEAAYEDPRPGDPPRPLPGQSEEPDT